MAGPTSPLRRRAIGALLWLWCLGAPVPAFADALVAIKDFVACRLYLPQSGQNPGKFYVSFTESHRVPWAIRSITVEGPGGFAFAFNQAPLTALNLNGYHHIPATPGIPADTVYFGLTEDPMPDGIYTVTVVDVLGRAVTGSRTFVDGSASFVPKIDSIDHANVVPADGARNVSITPVLSWDVAVGGNLFYVARIRVQRQRVFEDDVFGGGGSPDQSVVAIPESVLERGVRYNWNVEVCDRPVYSEINNCAWLPTSRFTTER